MEKECAMRKSENEIGTTLKEYDKILEKLQNDYQAHKDDATTDTLLIENLNAERNAWLLKHGLTQDDLDYYKKQINLFGRPMIPLKGGRTITFARGELKDILRYRLMSDEELIDHWKSYASCSIMGSISLSDMMHQGFIERELDLRPETITEAVNEELRQWAKEAEADANRQQEEWEKENDMPRPPKDE